ncbi:MAG: methylmalonyl Co-A mutase-associated GTPase MeaB [Planctomycetes bacterium]|nr:methylmalonyl Co-A mutase-associated GTPase MeaB [Planctomycetota bacterium]
MDSLVERFRSGDRRALARLITRAENRSPGFAETLDAIYGSTGRGFRIGVTGPPGAGKSTIVDGLAAAFRAAGDSVAVLAIDPTSPFTGGALLGDRIRMRCTEDDSNIFVRSMATRGSLGGLARATVDAADLLDAFGYKQIMIETVGVGQAEHDVMTASDVVLVILYPGGGDSVQAMKAGLMEIADIFVVNKSDHPAADRLVDDIEQMLELRARRDAWRPPVVQCVATERRGIAELVLRIENYKSAREAAGDLAARRRERREAQVRRAIEEELALLLFEKSGFQDYITRELDRRRPPYAIAAEVVNLIKNSLKHAI